MRSLRRFKAGTAALLFASAVIALAPGIASASSHAHDLAAIQHQLEVQLQNRVVQLNRLGTDISNAKSLTANHVTALTADVSTASTNINALVTKVPTDTTLAQLREDRASMLRQNRVFAVLTPQVFLTIQADAIAAEVLTYQGQEAGLLAAVNALNGEPAYNNAFNHYTQFVKFVNAASLGATNVATAVLAQTPADFPGDTSVFVHANRALLEADIALAHAGYDATVVGLASGGYSGS